MARASVTMAHGEVEYADLVQARRAMDGANVRLGLVFFLIAEAVFFVGLIFVALSVRRDALAWPPPGATAPDVAALLVNTGVILISGLTMLAGARAMRAGRVRRLGAWTAVTAALGVAFLSGQWTEFQAMGGWRTGDGLYNTLFNVVSALHGAHVILGLLLLGVVLFRAGLGSLSDERHDFVRGAAWFWYLVSTVWLALLAALVAL